MELQIKTTMKYHFIPIRMGTIKKILMSVGKNMEDCEPLCIAGEYVKW